MLVQCAPGQIPPTHPTRPAILTRRLVALPLFVLTLLVLRTALPALALPVSEGHTPTMNDPLPTRVRYVHTLVVDADYRLALTPRVITVGSWQISVLPVQPDPQSAWGDIQRIASVTGDQTSVPFLLGHIQLAFQRLADDAMYAQQAHVAYTPDYAPVRTLLNVIDTDLAATLSVPPNAASNHGPCPVCAIE